MSFYIKSFISAFFLSFSALSQRTDLVFSRDEMPLFLLSFFRKNLIYEAHNFSSCRKLFYKRFKSINLKVVVITKHLKENFTKIGFRPENILVASDGVDLSDFDIDISKQEARVKTGLPSDKNIVMYTGHLFEWKGTGTLLQTARLISNDRFPISDSKMLFVFIGGTERDIKSFKQKAQGLNNVLILEHKRYNQIPLFLKAADVLVLPNSTREEISRSYTSPLKMFEYMASKRPIVASDLPSLREILNEKNSVPVNSDDALALAGGIKFVLKNPNESQKLTKKAFEEVKNYTWQKRVETIFKFIEEDFKGVLGSFKME
ncbi:MAG: hypothetical protein A2915_03320 [Candidatus Yanofskybacteria bacterium RIFCSPLOWO2_01_FULL_41_34]|uniref:Glycosyl transferase family 1 domain-containing protein n=1 Tax=Candidatus Yanofskybacteria bacterium RIFCSPHIGHO2_01_FULL_41_26 TaxID=1802661 RepID=A0A1F8EFE9_9BACT|nr:MAG: hypothetical protein A2649_01215 [Candidatus Yanofskybacteria bacterium RIFCSPHIGHO2_01_FULL_41_26]OGN21148.1 MAG: hypothetical protein A2915_03320 [Candidatus Yanofskybacteria bacterium RIFCSPLOWO2_01_FULL_41_34]